MTKEEFVKVWNKKGRVEKFCTLFFGFVIIPWMFGLVIAAMTIEPLLENFVMILHFMFYTVMVAFPFGLVGWMLEIFRKDKEQYDADRRERDFDRPVEGRLRGRDSASATSSD